MKTHDEEERRVDGARFKELKALLNGAKPTPSQDQELGAIMEMAAARQARKNLPKN
jgi:hypothetical protein